MTSGRLSPLSAVAAGLGIAGIPLPPALVGGGAAALAVIAATAVVTAFTLPRLRADSRGDPLAWLRPWVHACALAWGIATVAPPAWWIAPLAAGTLPWWPASPRRGGAAALAIAAAAVWLAESGSAPWALLAWPTGGAFAWVGSAACVGVLLGAGAPRATAGTIGAGLLGVAAIAGLLGSIVGGIDVAEADLAIPVQGAGLLALAAALALPSPQAAVPREGMEAIGWTTLAAVGGAVVVGWTLAVLVPLSLAAAVHREVGGWRGALGVVALVALALVAMPPLPAALEDALPVAVVGALLVVVFDLHRRRPGMAVTA